jgi:hypothetical protein
VKRKTPSNQHGLPTDFIERFGQYVTGFISGGRAGCSDFIELA